MPVKRYVLWVYWLPEIPEENGMSGKKQLLKQPCSASALIEWKNDALLLILIFLSDRSELRGLMERHCLISAPAVHWDFGCWRWGPTLSGLNGYWKKRIGKVQNRSTTFQIIKQKNTRIFWSVWGSHSICFMETSAVDQDKWWVKLCSVHESIFFQSPLAAPDLLLISLHPVMLSHYILCPFPWLLLVWKLRQILLPCWKSSSCHQVYQYL